MSRRTISIIIPALNEEGNLQNTIDHVLQAAAAHFAEWELIIINDGSTDRTLEIAAANQKKHPGITILSNPVPRNIGACYDLGRRQARMQYCVMVQGDNPFTAETLAGFFAHVGEADFLCGYWENPAERSLLRRAISSFYTHLLNLILHRRMRYYNGLQLYRTAWLKTIEIQSTGFGYQAEVLVQALRDGLKGLELPTAYVERPGGGVTKVFRLRNILNVLKTIGRLRALRTAKMAGGV